MIKVNKKINLHQLDQELNGKGLVATNNENNEIVEIGLADNNDATEAQLQSAIAAHVAIDEAEAKATARATILNRLGLTAEEAALLLS
jgi:hypothetical protein